MANELLVGVKIGAVLSGTFQAAFASARGTGVRLGQAADEAMAFGAGFDLAATLGLLLQKSAVTALHPALHP